MSLYRNASGYSDPTAAKALEKIVREERKAEKTHVSTEVWRSDDEWNRVKKSYAHKERQGR